MGCSRGDWRFIRGVAGISKVEVVVAEVSEVVVIEGEGEGVRSDGGDWDGREGES